MEDPILNDAHYVASTCDALARTGHDFDGSYPWHNTRDPYLLLVAERFLRQTTRVVAARVYKRISTSFPTLETMANADPATVADLAAEAGLSSRARSLPILAQQILRLGRVPETRKGLQELPLVGPYSADALLLYAFERSAFPLDRGVQRTLRRAMLGDIEVTPSHPYRDVSLLAASETLSRGINPAQIRNVHLGVLHVAWSWCRPKPEQRKCSDCPLSQSCFASSRGIRLPHRASIAVTRGRVDGTA